MIEVTCLPSGDIAECDDPEAALVAAKQLCQDDADAVPILGRVRRCEFRVDGRLVRTVLERDLWSIVLAS